MATVSASNRQGLVRRGQRLEYFTIGYNSLEGLISIVEGMNPRMIEVKLESFLAEPRVKENGPVEVKKGAA